MSSGGLERSAITIPKGNSSATTFIVSSTQVGSATLSAEATGLVGASASITFKEKPRFCMGCGGRMSVKDARCGHCGASPADFGGPETKSCHCGATIPFTAKFCSECGAKQAPAARGA